MENLGGNVNELFDFEDLPKKAPRAIGGLLAAIGGFLAVVGFIFNWYPDVSGLKLATDSIYGSNTLLCCVPLLGLFIILVGLASAAVPFLRREIPFVKPITGALLVLLSVVLLCPIFIEINEDASIGWWCAPVGAVLIALGAIVAVILPSVLEKDVS